MAIILARCMLENRNDNPGMSFKRSAQAMSLSEVEEGRGLQAPIPGVVANSPVSLSSSLPFIPINLTFKVPYLHDWFSPCQVNVNTCTPLVPPNALLPETLSNSASAENMI